MKKMLLILVMTAMPAFAWAHSCPSYVDMINESLGMSDELGLDDATVEEIEELRDQGLAHHEEGEHDRAIAALDQALGMIEGGV